MPTISNEPTSESEGQTLGLQTKPVELSLSLRSNSPEVVKDMSEEVFALKKQNKTGYIMDLTKRDLELDFLPSLHLY